MRSRSSTPGRTRAARPEASALLATALVALAAGCLDASRGEDTSDAGGVEQGDGGGRKPFDAAAAEGDATPDASSGPADLFCPATTLAPSTIDGDDSDTSWDDAGASVTFDAATSSLKAEVDDYQPPTSVTFRCLHTSNTLFLFFHVVDGDGASSGAIEGGSPDVRENDAVVVFLDGAGDRSGTYAGDDHWLLVDAADMATQSDAMWFMAGASADEHSLWRLELAIPLESIAPDEVRGDVIGFDVAVHDEDGFAGGAPDLWAFWRAKADACADCCAGVAPAPYCDTRQFGTLELGD